MFILCIAIVLEAVRERLTQLRDFTERDLTSDLKGVSATLNVSHKVTMQLCRAAVIGQQVIRIQIFAWAIFKSQLHVYFSTKCGTLWDRGSGQINEVSKNYLDF